MSGRILAVDHVQLAMPPGGEAAARAFYRDVLGFEEVPKPPALAGRGGVWFRAGAAQLHLGAETGFRPPAKAHPALLVEGLPSFIVRCTKAGHPVERDVPLPGVERAHVSDPFGNRIELVERPRTTPA
jgi:catechol 2,3-dioxygenase-like lactoylglutathione lyase family enzyme